MAVAVEPLSVERPTPEPPGRIESVSYWYPGSEKAALEDLSLAIEPGLTVLVGPSGGGKSTCLRLLDGLVPQFHGGRISGRVTVGGLDAFRTPIARLGQTAGLVFQDPETQSIYGTVEREVAFGLENLGLPRSVMRERVVEALEMLGIERLRSRRLATLSGGERQRVQLAAVLALRPALIALDEPTSQLDPDGTAAVAGACARLARSGIAVVVAEHRPEPFLARAARIVAVGEHPPLHVARAGRSARSHPRRDRLAWTLRDVAVSPARGLPPLLEGVNAAGVAGEVVAVVGPNGGGKTTLLRTMAGLGPPASGTVERAPGRTAYLPQNPAALLHLPTVRAEVELTIRRTGEAPAFDTLAAFGLLPLADRYPRDLSAGERQRAALAAVLAGSPAVALLDEPTRGMDVSARARLTAAIETLAEAGASVVIATHDEDLVRETADRVLVVGDGRVVERQADRPVERLADLPAPSAEERP